MWFVGLLVGSLVGLLFESLPLALIAGLGGAFILHKLSAQRASRTDAGSRTALSPETAAAPTAPDDLAVRTLQRQVAALEQRVTELERALGREPAALPALAPRPASLVVAPVTEAPPMPEPAPEPEPAPRAIEPLASPPLAAEPANGETPTVPMPPDLAPATPPGPAPARPRAPNPYATRGAAAAAAPARPLRERLPAPIARLIFGGNMLVKLGVLILFLGLAFLLRYTAERVTVPIELRYAGVALVGATLLALGWMLRRQRAGYALILQGAGIGVFYLTTLAAMKLNGLLPATAGFAFLFAVAVLAAALAVLQNAPALAIVAVLEGFAAPVLASTGSNRPVALFAYLLVLDVGIVLVAWFRAWRLINLIGLVGTFTLAAGWARQYYTDAQYGTVQPFLAAFFLLFVAIGVLFARRTLFDAAVDERQPLAARAAETLRRVGRVDSALVFGAPLAAFGLQYLLMRPWAFGAAFSALAFAAFYLALGRLVFATQPRGLALLAEAYAIVGVIFGTLAIPLGLEGQWTGATWAIEAAGMFWLGVRQQRPYARAFAFAVLGGAVVQVLRGIGVTDAGDGPLLHGSVIGPLMLAGGAFAMWMMSRRARLGEGPGAEALAALALPWIGMAALSLLPWQTLTPMWAAAAMALLALAAFGVARRFELAPLRPVVHAMQAFAVVAFIASLHRGAPGAAALDSGWRGMLAAASIALSVLVTAALAMREARRAALATGLQPRWPLTQIVGVLAGVSLLHLAMLFGMDLPQAALIWPFTAVLVLWVALRMAHAPLAALAGVLHGMAAVLFVTGPSVASALRPAFANLGFWTPLALGLTALVAGDWLRNEARHVAAAPIVDAPRRWVNGWCAHAPILWLPVGWGLLWWLVAMLGESSRVLSLHELSADVPAAVVGIVAATSLLASLVAARRDWRQLGQATLATLPGWIAAAVAAITAGPTFVDYVPSAALGWLAWPLALAWLVRLLRAQQRWFPRAWLEPLHVVGLWFFLLLAAREGQWQLGRFGETNSSWSLLGWALVPALTLWALRSRALLSRWPLTTFRRAYVEVGLQSVAVYLLGWCWVTNVLSPGEAAPLPYLPLLNPLELAQALVLVALVAWWQVLPAHAALRLSPPLAKGVAAVTAWALLTGVVLRSCHHFAEVPWRADALYGSWLTQAALSITWALCGVITMVLGHRRTSRPVWVSGAVLLGVVVLKLFFIELANQGGLFRIVSFIAVGALLLLVGYFAPVPPAKPGLAAEPAA